MATIDPESVRLVSLLCGQVRCYDLFIDRLYDETNQEVTNIFTEDARYFLSTFDLLPDPTTYRGCPYIPKDEFILAYLNREACIFVDHVIKRRPTYKLDKTTIWTIKMNYQIATRQEDPSWQQYVKDKNRKIRYTYEYLLGKGLIQ